MSNTPSPIEILKDLISFKTVSCTPNIEIIDYLENIFRPLGFDLVRIYHPNDKTRANLFCRIGPDIEDGLMLSGHTDVVPVTGQDWAQDPFKLHEDNGFLYGRGTADMKGFIAASCHALAKFDFKRLTKPLTLLWTFDEEVGCFGSATAMLELKNYTKYLPKAALIGEPTDFNILRMHKGHTTVKIFSKGQGAHSSDPDLGISAIKALNQCLRGVFELENELRNEESLNQYFHKPFVVLNVGEIKGGTAVNIIPDEAYARLGYRPMPATLGADIFERVKNACYKYLDYTKAKIKIEIEHATPAMMTKAGTTLEKILRPLANKGEQVAAGFCTDAGNIAQSGIECLIFGPGSIDVAHQANEHVAKQDIILAGEKITQVVDRFLCS